MEDLAKSQLFIKLDKEKSGRLKVISEMGKMESLNKE